jgi:hypothetical protein
MALQRGDGAAKAALAIDINTSAAILLAQGKVENSQRLAAIYFYR